jgi:hypothetical protein
MRAFKDIIRTLFVKMDEMEPIISEKDFKKYVGVSKEKFENKLGKIDVALDSRAFKGSKSFFSFGLPINTNEYPKQRKNTTRGLNSYLSEPSVDKNWEPVIREWGASTGKLDDICSAYLVLQDADPHIFDEYYATIAQFEYDLVSSLQYKYGDGWFEVYQYVKKIQKTIKVLREIERLLFKEQQEKFINSSMRLFRFEYYDLLFTVKKWEASDQVSFGSYPFCSYKTLNHNEIKGIRKAA